jgi:hypothetical protein
MAELDVQNLLHWRRLQAELQINIARLWSEDIATNRTFVEFGVETGVETNTTKLLIEGWRGLWIEGAPLHLAEIRKTFADKLAQGLLKIREAFITAESINELITEGGIEGEIDLLSIDIDHNDYWVWKAITVIDPRVVVIEYNATLRPPMSLVIPYHPKQTADGTNFFRRQPRSHGQARSRHGLQHRWVQFFRSKCVFCAQRPDPRSFSQARHRGRAFRTGALLFQQPAIRSSRAPGSVRDGLRRARRRRAD